MDIITLGGTSGGGGGAPTGAAGGDLTGTYPNPALGVALKGNSNPDANGYLGWSMDALLMSGNTAPVAGTIYTMKIPWGATATVTTVDFWQQTAGVALVNSTVGIYNAAGTQLAVTPDLSSAWSTGGTKVSANNFTAPTSITGGYGIYITLMFLIQTITTTAPTFGSTGGPTLLQINSNVTGGASRFGVYATSATALPSPATMANIVLTGGKVWFAGLR